MEKLTINCVGGIGDILFCEPIFRHYQNKLGYKPFVIINDHMLWIANYIDSAQFIGASVMEKTPYHKDNMEMTEFYLPLRYANQVFRNLDRHDHHDLENMMLDKYRLLGLPEDLWKTIQVNFHEERIRKLTELKGIVPGESKYILINNHCQIGSIEIKPETDLRIVMMENIEGFNVLDWAGLISAANENHHLSTSTFFIMQVIENKVRAGNVPGDIKIWGCKNFIYPRPNEDGLRGISQLQPDFILTLKK